MPRQPWRRRGILARRRSGGWGKGEPCATVRFRVNGRDEFLHSDSLGSHLDRRMSNMWRRFDLRVIKS
jgi:hypothetical protein